MSHVTVSLIWSDLNKCHMLRFLCLVVGGVCVGRVCRCHVLRFLWFEQDIVEYHAHLNMYALVGFCNTDVLAGFCHIRVLASVIVLQVLLTGERWLLNGAALLYAGVKCSHLWNDILL